MFFTHANAAVTHIKVYGNPIIDTRRLAHFDNNLPLFSKLYRVTGEVDEDLPQSSRVTTERVGQIRITLKHQFQVLVLTAHHTNGGQVIQHVVQRKGNIFKFEFARFQLRKIEDVVDNGTQGVRRAVHLGQVIFLFFV